MAVWRPIDQHYRECTCCPFEPNLLQKGLSGADQQDFPLVFTSPLWNRPKKRCASFAGLLCPGVWQPRCSICCETPPLANTSWISRWFSPVPFGIAQKACCASLCRPFVLRRLAASMCNLRQTYFAPRKPKVFPLVFTSPLWNRPQGLCASLAGFLCLCVYPRCAICANINSPVKANWAFHWFSQVPFGIVQKRAVPPLPAFCP